MTRAPVIAAGWRSLTRTTMGGALSAPIERSAAAKRSDAFSSACRSSTGSAPARAQPTAKGSCTSSASGSVSRFVKESGLAVLSGST